MSIGLRRLDWSLTIYLSLWTISWTTDIQGDFITVMDQEYRVTLWWDLREYEAYRVSLCAIRSNAPMFWASTIINLNKFQNNFMITRRAGHSFVAPL